MGITIKILSGKWRCFEKMHRRRASIRRTTMDKLGSWCLRGLCQMGNPEVRNRTKIYSSGFVFGRLTTRSPSFHWLRSRSNSIRWKRFKTLRFFNNPPAGFKLGCWLIMGIKYFFNYNRQGYLKLSRYSGRNACRFRTRLYTTNIVILWSFFLRLLLPFLCIGNWSGNIFSDWWTDFP